MRRRAGAHALGARPRRARRRQRPAAAGRLQPRVVSPPRSLPRDAPDRAPAIRAGARAAAPPAGERLVRPRRGRGAGRSTMPATPTISSRVGSLLWSTSARGFWVRDATSWSRAGCAGIDAERAAGLVPLALAAAHSGLALGSVTLGGAVGALGGRAPVRRGRGTARRRRAPVSCSSKRGRRAPARREWAKPPPGHMTCWRTTIRGGRAAACLRGSSALLIGDRPEAERLLEEGARRGDRAGARMRHRCAWRSWRSAPPIATIRSPHPTSPGARAR